jgi:hypothetical protein
LRIGDGYVTGGPGIEHWPPDDAELLAGWLAGVRAICAAESRSGDEGSLRLLLIAALTVLGDESVSKADRLWGLILATFGDLCRRYDELGLDVWDAVGRHFDRETNTPVSWLLALLAELGMVAGGKVKPAITPLGSWAAGNLAIGLPGAVDPNLSAAELLAEVARFSDENQQAHVASRWLAERKPAEAAKEILTAAEGMSPLLRYLAVWTVEGLGEDALPVWREMTAAPCVGPYARAVLAHWEEGPQLSDPDSLWLGVEYAAADLEAKGPDAALSSIWESMPGADLDAKLAAAKAVSHPDAAVLASAIADFAASGAPRSIDQIAVLKVALAGYRPPIWRRVQLPVTASLGDLHVVIQVLFGWDGDHRHLFRAGKAEFSDPFTRLETSQDEDTVRIGEVMSPGTGKISYVYDFGTWWEHEITLGSTRRRDPGRDYPVCVAYQGDSPVEYWSEEPAESEPFDQAEVNRRLAALGKAED